MLADKRSFFMPQVPNQCAAFAAAEWLSNGGSCCRHAVRFKAFEPSM
jgi:hypothetical protein